MFCQLQISWLHDTRRGTNATAGCSVINIAVIEFPPKLFCKRRVSFESRYGICTFVFVSSGSLKLTISKLSVNVMLSNINQTPSASRSDVVQWIGGKLSMNTALSQSKIFQYTRVESNHGHFRDKTNHHSSRNSAIHVQIEWAWRALQYSQIDNRLLWEFVNLLRVSDGE